MNRGLECGPHFETGNIYGRDEQSCREWPALGLLSAGPLGGPHWREQARDGDLFRIKGALEALMGQIRYEPYSFESAEHPYFEPGSALSLAYKEQRSAGWARSPARLLEFYGVKQDVWAAEIDLGCLFEKQPRPFAYIPVPKFPADDQGRFPSDAAQRAVSGIEKSHGQAVAPAPGEFRAGRQVRWRGDRRRTRSA